MRLIDADALKKELYKFKLSDSCVEHEWALQAADDVAKYTLDAIKNAPTIDAVPVVHAKWLYDDEDDRKNVECSHCHMRWAVVSDDPDSDYLVLHMTADELLFCPSCGAKMDYEEDEDA